MKPSDERKYESLSPFELKNKLIQLSERRRDHVMLNAGRGNPNWIALEPRYGFSQLLRFALEESRCVSDCPALGYSPVKGQVACRFKEFLKQHKLILGVEFLKKAFNYIDKHADFEPDDVLIEMVDGVLGDYYPMPDRMLCFCERIVHMYLEQEMLGGNSFKGRMDLFATEGGTAAIDYIFNSLMENKLLHKGDTIALGSPIFTPYLEIPRLNDYELVELDIKQSESHGWQYPDSELEKLLDPKVKAFFLVNPSNPTAVSMSEESLEKIAKIVEKRQDLIIITDDVYGTFVNGFTSIMSVVPYNTILVYSFSKYFGATGWRLGVIGIHEDNRFDKMIAKLPQKDRDALHERYHTTVLEPDKMKLIERMVADSRSVALHHTAGLSTPQQVQMALFALFALIDKENHYKKAAQTLVKKRYQLLYDAVGMKVPMDHHFTYYYATIDIPKLAQERYGKAFATWLVKSHEPIDFVVRLAEEKSVVLMDGGGFDAPNMSIRVSLANLDDVEYSLIGAAISELLEKYYKEFR